MLRKYCSITFVFILAFAVNFFIFKSAQAEEMFPSATSSDATSTESTSPDTSTVPENWLVEEPVIRVGLAKTSSKVLFTSPFPYSLYSGGVDLGILPENELGTITYADGVYRFVSDSLTVTSSDYLRLIPNDLSDYFSILSLDRHLVTRSQLNFNVFRGGLEYRFAPKSGMPYLINELLLENYVAGIGETSNGAPEEYIKALQIAARTYAYKNISKDPPSTDRMFDVYASTIDQLYLGYNFESFSPRIAFFTAGTRGMMVTYKSEPVTTYYFSRSNGYTKTKKGVPWLKSVKAKYDKGYRMLGHGYGMSNRDAAMRARKDGWTYDKILKYYYSGTDIEQMY